MNKQQSISNSTIENPEKWVDLYGDYLYRYARYRVYEGTVAEDLVQETFLAALRSIKNFQYHSSIKTWLSGILKHKIIDHFRKKAKEQQIDDIQSNINNFDDLFTKNGQWKIKPANSWVLLHRARMYLRRCLEIKWFANVDVRESI